ncbi:MAG: hypothetical protein ACFFG0_14150 [Candidatus Thorarchaeota archaeon]
MPSTYEQGDQVELTLYIYDVNSSLIDPDGYVGGTEPTYTVKDPYGDTQQAATLATRESIGYYSGKYTLPRNAATGLWSYEWYFTVTGVENPVLPVNDRTERFEVALPGTATYSITVLRDILRKRLKDNHPDYRKQRWTDEELEIFLQNALWDINVTPPATTYFFLDDYYISVPDWKALIIEGAVIFSLIAQGIFEIGKEFSYSDNGISITIDRGGKYQSFTNMLMTAYDQRKILIKKHYFMKAITPYVIKTGEIEQRLRTYAPSQYRIR